MVMNLPAVTSRASMLEMPISSTGTAPTRTPEKRATSPEAWRRAWNFILKFGISNFQNVSLDQ